MKSVKLFLNPLENSRGTFPWNIVKRTFKASDPPDTGHRTPDTSKRFIQASDSNARFKRAGYGTGTGTGISNARFKRK